MPVKAMPQACSQGASLRSRRLCVLCRGLGCPQPAFQNIRKGYSETLLATKREEIKENGAISENLEE